MLLGTGKLAAHHQTQVCPMFQVSVHMQHSGLFTKNVLARKEMSMDPWLVSFPKRIVLWSVFSQSNQQDSHTTQSSHPNELQCTILKTRNHRKKLPIEYSLTV